MDKAALRRFLGYTVRSGGLPIRQSALFLLSLVALVSFTGLAVACSGDDADEARSNGDRDRDNDDIRDSRDDCEDAKEDDGQWGTDPEDGCPGTVDDLIELARADIDAFWAKQFEGEGVVYDGPINFTGYTTEIETECGTAVLNNAFYCPIDHSIYYDSNFLGEELESNGDFGPVLIIAHEWGHLVQSLLGILDDEELLTIQTELQADCMAGVWAADADKRGLLEEGDFDEGIITLFRVGDPRETPFFDPAAHGRSGERITAFEDGFEAGLEACTLE